jgi:hypothetical protein
VPKISVALAFLLAACSSSSPATGSSGATPAPDDDELPTATTHDWLPSDGERVLTVFVRECLTNSTWADDFAQAEGRQPVLRVGEVKAEVEDVTVLTEALGGQIEKALLDSKKVQVAASIADLAELQELQSARMLSGNAVDPTAGADLSSDHILTVRVTSAAEPNEDGVMRIYNASFRVVNANTGAMECVAMGKSKKLVVPPEE